MRAEERSSRAWKATATGAFIVATQRRRLFTTPCPVCRGLEKERVKTELKLTGVLNGGDGCEIEPTLEIAD